MKETYTETIVAVDAVLDILRTKWMEEKDEKKKSETMKKIDTVLDERSRLMKLRDA